MDKTIISIQKLYVDYEKKKVIDNLNLEIPRSKILSIVGPNGSGKSTIIKAISRTIKISSGIIRFENRDIKKIKGMIFAKNVAVLSQQYDCPKDISVKELVSYGRYAYSSWFSSETKEDSEIVNWAMKRTGVDEFENRKIGTLSGGEKQRVWIAMALAQKPQVLLLDEPTTYLDLCHQIELLELIKSLNIADGLTVVMVLHDINQAIQYSDKIVVIDHGRVVIEGLAEDIINDEVLKSVFKINAAEINHSELERAIYYPKNVIN
jgi:iron complex transport system ATP-binding protein